MTSRKWFIVAVVVLAIIVGIYAAVAHHSSSRPAQPQTMSAAEQAYLKNLQVTNPRMSAASNFLGNTLYYLDGTLANKGQRTVRRVDARLTFLDPFGEVVLRQDESLLNGQSPPLRGNQSRAIHLTFEHLPAEWNQGPPTIELTYVGF